MAASLPIGACCRACGYALAGIAGARCPECGRGFDPTDPRTFDRSARARRWRRVRRPLVAVVSIALLVYGTFPRGYVRGTLVYVPGGGAPQETFTLWRLASPRWLARVPYPKWTRRGPDTAAPVGRLALIRVNIDRRTWTEQGSSAQAGRGAATPDQRFGRDDAMKLLEALVRRKCQGMGGVFVSPDDSAMPEELRVADEPW